MLRLNPNTVLLEIVTTIARIDLIEDTIRASRQSPYIDHRKALITWKISSISEDYLAKKIKILRLVQL